MNVFVDYEPLGRKVNILREQGVTGFSVLNIGGLTTELGGFHHKDEPEIAIEAIKDHTERAIQVNPVVDDDQVKPITRALATGLTGKRIRF